MKILSILLMVLSFNVSANTILSCKVSQVVDESMFGDRLSEGSNIVVSSDRFEGLSVKIGEFYSFSQRNFNNITLEPSAGFQKSVKIEDTYLIYRIVTTGQAMNKTGKLYVTEIDSTGEATEDTLLVANLSCK